MSKAKKKFHPSQENSDRDIELGELLSETPTVREETEEVDLNEVINLIIEYFGNVKEAEIMENLHQREGQLLEKVIAETTEDLGNQLLEVLTMLIELYSEEEEESNQRINDLIGFNSNSKEEVYESALEDAIQAINRAEKFNQKRTKDIRKQLKEHREYKKSISKALKEGKDEEALRDIVKSAQNLFS